MSADEDTYLCPTCGKPFDKTDRLFDFAIAAHEKDHTPQRNNPANMIRWSEDGLMWCCILCGAPIHIGEYTARQMIIGHCRVVHGSTTGSSSSTPVTARGGRGSGNGSRSVGEFIGDVAEDAAEVVIDGLGRAAGAILRAFGGD